MESALGLVVAGTSQLEWFKEIPAEEVPDNLYTICIDAETQIPEEIRQTEDPRVVTVGLPGQGFAGRIHNPYNHSEAVETIGSQFEKLRGIARARGHEIDILIDPIQPTGASPIGGLALTHLCMQSGIEPLPVLIMPRYSEPRSCQHETYLTAAAMLDSMNINLTVVPETFAESIDCDGKRGLSNFQKLGYNVMALADVVARLIGGVKRKPRESDKIEDEILELLNQGTGQQPSRINELLISLQKPRVRVLSNITTSSPVFRVLPRPPITPRSRIEHALLLGEHLHMDGKSHDHARQRISNRARRELYIDDTHTYLVSGTKNRVWGLFSIDPEVVVESTIKRVANPKSLRDVLRSSARDEILATKPIWENNADPELRMLFSDEDVSRDGSELFNLISRETGLRPYREVINSGGGG